MKPRAIAYVRQSKARDGETAADSLSLDAQLAAITRFCDDRGYTLARVIRDHDVSGEKWNRPGLQALLSAAESGEADVAVVFKLSRFSRNGLHQEMAYQELRENGMRVESVTEPGIDKPIVRFVHGGMNQQHNEDLRETLKANFAQRARRGLHHGRVPFGYRVVINERGRGGRYELTEPGASIVRRIFQRRIDGLGCDAIANELNTAGLRTSTGRLWYGETVRHVLSVPAYAGYAVHQDQIVGDLDPELMPPLIDRGTWQQVRRTFRPGQRQSQRDKQYTSWLEGHVIHGCGAPMWLTSDTNARFGGFRCGTRKKARALRCTERPVTITQHALEAAVTMCLTADLDARFRDPETAIAALLDAQKAPEIANEREMLRTQRGKVLKALKNAEDLVLMELRDHVWLIETQREYMAKLTEIDAQLAQFVDVPDPADLTAYISALDGIADVFPLADTEKRRTMLGALGDVLFAGGVVSMRYHPEFALIIPHPAHVQVSYERGFSGDGLNQFVYRRLS